MKYVTYAILIAALVTLANGAVAFFFRYNFITQEGYGPSLTPIYIIAAGILLGVIGLALNTRSGGGSRKSPISPGGKLGPLLEELRKAIVTVPFSRDRTRAATVSVLRLLASPAGRTDENCRAVDFALCSDDQIYTCTGHIEEIDPELAGVLSDMAGALHDTVRAPEIAKNSDSTPEQLLARLGESPE